MKYFIANYVKQSFIWVGIGLLSLIPAAIAHKIFNIEIPEVLFLIFFVFPILMGSIMFFVLGYRNQYGDYLVVINKNNVRCWGRDIKQISGFKIAFLGAGKIVTFKTQNGKVIDRLNLKAFNYRQIKEILTELQKHGKTIKIDSALEGVFVLDLDPVLDPVLKQHKRHLEV